MRNPYDFVRIDWDRGVERRSPSFHDRFEGLSGRIEGTITTLTPFFIQEPEENALWRIRYQRHIINNNGHPIIPGSSLKGLIRNLVETVGYGCWWLFKGEYPAKEKGRKIYYQLPDPFYQCEMKENLCVACRMFGMVQGRDASLKGHVHFDEAICTQPVEHDPIYTIILSTPKPRHTSFYLDKDDNPAGRKFYFHHSTPPEDREGWRPKKASSQNDAQNQYIQPLGAGSVFTFSAHFDNLAPDELRLLLYALVLEDNVRHKFGYGKPAGLGSVHIELTRLEMIDYEQRYVTPDGGKTVYEGEQLASYVMEQTAPYRNDQDNVTLHDLRRIWKWPGHDDIRYPSWQWFQDPENRHKRLDEIG
jgi:CRISPR/Cas system CSM-associated protein Csm3 (group 7 of RAMP superfamily)